MKIELKKGIFIEGFDDFPDWEILVDLRNDIVGVFEHGLLYQGKTSDITEVFAKDCVELEYFGEYWEGMWEYFGYCNFDINAPYDYVHTAKESILSACSSEYCIIYRNNDKIKSDAQEIVTKKKLSWNIERTDVQGLYNYKFSTSQWLESVDNPEYFGISHNDMKEKVIENLVSEFRIALNNVIFGDPVGREYVE